MPKVAFVVQRCGVEVNGGAEALCLRMAERMAQHWQVEVLTTCAIDYLTWKNDYPAGEAIVNGVTVRRFPVSKPRNFEAFSRLCNQIHAERHHLTLKQQENWMKAQGPDCPGLLNYIQTHRDDYDAFFFYTYLYTPTYFGVPLVADKAYIVPFAHDDWLLELPFWDGLFKQAHGFVFSTPEERDLLRNRFPTLPMEGPVVGVGIEGPPSYSAEAFRQTYGITEPFWLYAGRIDPPKNCGELFDFFLRLRSQDPTPRKLVLMGKATMPIPDHPDIIALGFVEEQTKWDAMAACDVLVMPSPGESLSIVLLEAWSVGRPVLVNGRCEVLVGQCRRANGGLWYHNFEEFQVALEKLSGAIGDQVGQQGKRYIETHYRWPRIESQYLQLLSNGTEGRIAV